MEKKKEKLLSHFGPEAHVFPWPACFSPGVSPAPGIGPAPPCGLAAPPFPCFWPTPRWRARSASAAPQAPVRLAFSTCRAPSPSPSLRREARTSVPHLPFLSPSRVFLSLPRQWRYSDGKSPVHRATWKAPVRQVIAVPRSPFLVRHSRPPIKPRTERLPSPLFLCSRPATPRRRQSPSPAPQSSTPTRP